jgi:hypothetical protein
MAAHHRADLHHPPDPQHLPAGLQAGLGRAQAGCEAHLHRGERHATHKHAEVRAWLAKNPRITLHFTPTGCSWLNLVECFFSIITRQAIRRGSFTSVKELITVIGAFIDSWNDHPRPFTWTKDAAAILASIKRAKTKTSGLTGRNGL